MPFKTKETIPLVALDDKYREVLLVPISNLPDKFAIVEPQDYQRLLDEDYTGTLCYYAYAIHAVKKRTNAPIRLARFIVGAQDNEYVKHTNLDKFDFRRSNLATVPKKTSGKRKPDPRPDRDYLKAFNILGPVSMKAGDEGYCAI